MILTIDIGGTSIKYGLVDSQGKITNQDKITTNNEDYSIFIKDILKVVDKFPDVIGISISAPGGVLENGKTTGLTAVPCILNQNIKKDIEKVTNKSVSIANDANCSVMSELFDDPEIKNAVGIVLGSGIGGGMFLNGKLYTGHEGIGSEFGVNYQMKEDGTLERIAISTVDMVNEHNEKYHQNVDAKQIFNDFKEGDRDSIETVENFFKRLAVLVLNIESSVHPQKIIFAGGITEEDSFLVLFEEQYEKVQEWVEWDLRVEHKVSRFKGLANLPGAAAFWLLENKMTN